MGKRKQNNKAFIKVAKQIRSDFQKQGINITWNQAQKWASQNIYPEFRGTPERKISKKKVDASFNKLYKKYGKREILTTAKKQVSPYADVRMVNPDIYESQAWWDLANIIEQLPAMAQVRVYAGSMGVTPIQVAGDYNEQDLKDMIETIREEIDNMSGLTFQGAVKVVPNRQDDNDPASYFIDLVFSTEAGAIVEEPTIEVGKAKGIDYSKMGIEEIKRAKKRQKRQAEKRKQRQKARTRTRPTTVGKKKKSPADLLKLLELLKEDYKDGIYTKEEYRIERQKLIDKFEKGGEI